MKTFVEKSKFEQTQALLALIQDDTTRSMPNRPVFLNKVHVTQRFLNDELQLGRATSTYAQYPVKEAVKEVPQEVQAETERSVLLTSRMRDPRRSVRESFIQLQKPEVRIKLEPKEEEEEPNTRLMRRRSCCCKWCGGISGKEQKHQDIVTNLQKYGRNPPVKAEPQLDESFTPQARSSPKRKTFNTMKSLRRGSTRAFPDSPTNPKKGVSCVEIDSKPKSKNLLSLKTKSKMNLSEEEAQPSKQELEKKEAPKSRVLSEAVKRNPALMIPFQEPDFVYTLQSIDEGHHEDKVTPQKQTKGTLFFRGSTIANTARYQRENSSNANLFAFETNNDTSFTEADKPINSENPHNLKIKLDFDSHPQDPSQSSLRRNLIVPTSLENVGNLPSVIDLRSKKLPYTNQIFEAADSKDEISDSPCNFRLRSLPDDVVREKIKFIHSLRAQDKLSGRVQTHGDQTPLTFSTIQNFKKSPKQKKKSPEKNFKITTLLKDSKTRIQGIYLQKPAIQEPVRRVSHTVTRLQSPSTRISTALNGILSPPRNSFAKIALENHLNEGNPISSREIKGVMTSPKISSNPTVKIVRKKNIRIKSEINPTRPTTSIYTMYGKPPQAGDLAMASPRTPFGAKKLSDKKELRKAS